MDCITKQNLRKFEKILVLFTLVVGLLLLSLVVPAMAETGSFDSVGGTVSTSYVTGGANNAYPNTSGIFIMNIQNQTGLSAVILATGQPWAVVPDAVTGVNLYAGNTIIGTGQFGFTYSASTGYYTTYLFISSLNIGTLTGNHYINFTTINNTVLWNLNGLQLREFSGPSTPVNSVQFRGELGGAGSTYLVGQDYMKYQSQEFHNTYSTGYTAPISTINVTKIIGGIPYPSKVYIMQGTTVLASNITLTSGEYHTNLAGIPYFSINVTDMWDNWYVSPLIFGSGTTPVYNLSVLPASIPPSGSTRGGIYSFSDPILSNINAVIWSYTDEFGDHLLSETDPNNLLNYGKTGGTWYGFNMATDGFTNNKGANLPNPVIISIPTTGLKSINVQISTNSGGYVSLTAPLQIGDANTSYTRTNVVPQEFLRGNLVTSAIVSFKSVLTGVWTNTTVDNWGQATISTQPAQYYDVYANAPGYLQGSRLGIKTSGYDVEQTYIVYMYPLNTTLLAGGNTILYVSLIDGSTLLPITTGAVVAQTAYASTFYTKQIVNSAGIATLYVPNNTKLFVFTEDTDAKYKGKSTFFETVVEPMYEIDFVLEVRKEQPTVAPTIPPGVQQPGAAPGVTIAPGQTYAPGVSYTWAPTPTYLTPRPTTTLPGYQVAYGNFTGFWAPFENMGVAMGARPSEVGVLMMFMLIIGFLILGGWAAGPLGAEVGVVAGMVCSVAFGFLPFAISIAVIAILCLYGALRIWGVTR